LLREALDVSTSNPRSAIVIGISAAEVGFKHLVAELVPDAEWLISKVPSPPLPKMLKEYLPLLPTKLTLDGSTPAPPKYVRTLLTDGVESRNTIAHAGQGGLHGQLLVDTLEAVRDMLYLFDYYAGHEWAFYELSTRFKEELGS
jgi:hypothetical protein